MGSSKTEQEDITTKLPLLLTKPHSHVQSPERSGMLTPPLYSTSASVPFRWEEEPGKPRQCTTPPTPEFVQKGLELPPRLLFLETTTTTPNNNKLNFSPTTVLDGPYSYYNNSNMGKSRFQSSSFRIVTRDYWHGSFRKRSSSTTTTASSSPDRGSGVGQLGHIVVLGRRSSGGVFGSWVWGKKKAFNGSGLNEVRGGGGGGGGGGHVFPASTGRDTEDHDGDTEDNDGINVKITRISRSGSFSSISSARSHSFWATIYEGLKQAVVVPWRSKKFKKDNNFVF